MHVDDILPFGDVWSIPIVKNGDFFPERNTCIEFTNSLEEEKFEEAKKDTRTRKTLQLNGFLDKKLEYRINDSGFRGHNFVENDRESVMTLGCSFCFGTGVFEENTLAGLIESTLGRRTYNLGLPGRSMDTVVRFVAAWIPYIKSKYVVVLQPFPHRREVLYRNHWYRITPTQVPPDPPMQGELPGIYGLLDTIDCNVQYTKNILALRQICNSNNSELILIPGPGQDEDDRNFLPGHNTHRKPDAIARDLVHPNRIYFNHLVNKYIVNKISSLQEE